MNPTYDLDLSRAEERIARLDAERHAAAVVFCGVELTRNGTRAQQDAAHAAMVDADRRWERAVECRMAIIIDHQEAAR